MNHRRVQVRQAQSNWRCRTDANTSRCYETHTYQEERRVCVCVFFFEFENMFFDLLDVRLKYQTFDKRAIDHKRRRITLNRVFIFKKVWKTIIVFGFFFHFSIVVMTNRLRRNTNFIHLFRFSFFNFTNIKNEMKIKFTLLPIEAGIVEQPA